MVTEEKMNPYKLSVFGATGFVGRNYMKYYNGIHEHRNCRNPLYSDVLYLISTVDNYNIHENPYKDIDTNLTHLIEVLEGWRKVTTKYTDPGCFNFISSWFVYGRGYDQVGALEEDPCNPTGFYSITKRCAEQLLISYCQTYGLHYRIIRLAGVIGPDAPFNKKRNALQYLIDEMANDRPIELYNDGNFYRNFIHVDDTVNAINHILKHGAVDDIYNVGNYRSEKFSELIQFAHWRLQSKSLISSIPQSAFHAIVQAPSFHMNISKLQNLGYRPMHTGFDAVDDIVSAKYLNGRSQQCNSDHGHPGHASPQGTGT